MIFEEKYWTWKETSDTFTHKLSPPPACDKNACDKFKSTTHTLRQQRINPYMIKKMWPTIKRPLCVWGTNIQIEDNIMDFDGLKIRTIHEAYHTLPLEFREIVPWCNLKETLQRGNYAQFAITIRLREFSNTTTDEINTEYVASVSECTCKLDLIQLTAIQVLANIRVAPNEWPDWLVVVFLQGDIWHISMYIFAKFLLTHPTLPRLPSTRR